MYYASGGLPEFTPSDFPDTTAGRAAFAITRGLGHVPVVGKYLPALLKAEVTLLRLAKSPSRGHEAEALTELVDVSTKLHRRIRAHERRRKRHGVLRRRRAA